MPVVAALPAIAAVASAGVGAAAQAGAFGGGGGAGGGGGYVPPGLREMLYSRGTMDMLDAERSILDDALAQGKAVEPEMYRALGLEPIYDREEDPELADRSAALAGKQERLNDLRLQKVGLQGAKGRGAKQQRRDIQRRSKQLNKEITILSRDVEQRGAVGRRVVGFKPLAGVADPTGSAGNAFGAALDQFNLHLSDALSGKEPLDPTLKRTFDGRERTLRERLRRQMGPDYETSTGGAQALANFDREKSEAFSQYNRESIETYATLSERRAGALSDLTSGKLRNLAFPAAFRSELGRALEGAAGAREEISRRKASERGIVMEAAQSASAQRAAQSNARSQALGGLLEKTASGLASINLQKSAPEEGGTPPEMARFGAYGISSDKVASLLGQ